MVYDSLYGCSFQISFKRCRFDKKKKLIQKEVIWWCALGINKLIQLYISFFAVTVFLNVDPVKVESRHPTAIIRRSTLYLLRNLSLSCGIYAEQAQKEAVSALCGLMRKILDAGCNYGISK